MIETRKAEKEPRRSGLSPERAGDAAQRREYINTGLNTLLIENFYTAGYRVNLVVL